MSWPLTSLGPFTVFVPVNKAFKGTSVSQTTQTHSHIGYTNTTLYKHVFISGENPACQWNESSISRQAAHGGRRGEFWLSEERNLILHLDWPGGWIPEWCMWFNSNCVCRFFIGCISAKFFLAQFPESLETAYVMTRISMWWVIHFILLAQFSKVQADQNPSAW